MKRQKRNPMHRAYNRGYLAGISGKSKSLCAAYSEVKRVYVESLGDAEAKFTANDVKDFFASADAACLSRIQPLVCKTLIKPGDTLIVPWGWLVAEQFVNGKVKGGLRWLEISEESSLAFEKNVMPCC